MGNCFSCNKKMIGFLSYGSRKDVLRNGYRPPDEMKNSDRLCKSCLLEIKNNQTRGRTYNKAVDMTEQIILTIFFPGFAALRIEKWMKLWAYSVFPQYGIIIVVGFFEMQFSEFPFMALLLYFIFPLNYYWILRWTKEWNEDAI